MKRLVLMLLLVGGVITFAPQKAHANSVCPSSEWPGSEWCPFMESVAASDNSFALSQTGGGTNWESWAYSYSGWMNSSANYTRQNLKDWAIDADNNQEFGFSDYEYYNWFASQMYDWYLEQMQAYLYTNLGVIYGYGWEPLGW